MGYFNDVITLRNKMINENVSWPGEEHLILILASMLDDMDLFSRKHKETGEPLTVEDALRNFYNVSCALLNTEGHQVSARMGGICERLLKKSYTQNSISNDVLTYKTS